MCFSVFNQKARASSGGDSSYQEDYTHSSEKPQCKWHKQFYNSHLPERLLNNGLLFCF